jgi:hypothetical protein
MKTEITTHLESAAQSLRQALKEASVSESPEYLKKILNVIDLTTDLSPKYSFKLNTSPYDYYNFDGGDHIIFSGSSSADTIRLG